jgi:hypothetical protein
MTGIAAGVLRSQTTSQETTEGLVKYGVQNPAQLLTPQPPTQNDDERLSILENRILTLTSRLDAIEATQDFELPIEQGFSQTNERRGVPGSLSDELPGRPRRAERSMSVHLVEAGIDNFTAEAITQEQNDLTLLQLDLRDKAVRADYLDSDRYRDELRSLRDQTRSIRQEVGDEHYDRYLFASGQTNRIRISSVMTTSAAENAGISDGDVLVSYAQQRIFTFSDLQTASSQGVRDEPVFITIIRDDREMSLTIPRGPLGVQLIPTRVNPSNQ